MKGPRTARPLLLLILAACAPANLEPAGVLDEEPPGERAAAPALVPLAPAAAPRSRILVTLEEELKRASAALAERKPRPYHLGYQVEASTDSRLEAQNGALVGATARRKRELAVDVRVGSHAFDAHHPDRNHYTPQGTTPLPLEDDDTAIRAITRRQTEARYRAVVQRLRWLEGRRKGSEPTGPADFSRAEPAVSLAEPVVLELDRPAWEQRLRALSARFRGVGDVNTVVSLEVGASNRWMVNSEGAVVQGGRRDVRGYLLVDVPRAGGARASRSRDVDLGDVDPGAWEARLGQELDGLLAETRALASPARLESRWSGPAVFSAPAAAALFHVALGHLEETARERPDPQMEAFQKRVGQRVLPRLLSVYDDPTAGRLGQVALWGAYPVDDEGVRAQRVELIKDGVLSDFLRSRTPGPGAAGSNGHGRRQEGQVAVGRQATLVVRPSHALGAEELRERLREEARRQGKAFGVVIHELDFHYNPATQWQKRFLYFTPRVSKVFEDGRPDEPIEVDELVGDPLDILTSIRAASDDYRAWNRFCYAESGSLPTSAVSPSVLAVHVELTPADRPSPPPVLPRPPTTPRPGPRIDDDAVRKAMTDELARSMRELRGPGGAPFHILYEVIDAEQGKAEAAAGAVVETDTRRFRGLRVEVRLGDRTFDSGNVWERNFWPARLPTDDDPSTLRRELWARTEGVYRKALRALEQKRRTFADGVRGPDQAATDFAEVEPARTVFVSRGARAPLDLAALGRRAAQASAVFREPALAEAIKHSRVVNDHVIVRRRLLTSEGAWTDERRALARLHVVASADPDATFWSGLDLTFDAASPEELPGAEAVARGARQLAAEAIASRKAPRAEAGKAVVLFEPQPAGALLETMIGADLSGTPRARPPRGREREGSWRDPPSELAPKLGQPVAPAFLDLVDDPTMEAGPGQAVLFGAYAADAEGVPAQRVSLVERGVMKSLLMSRIPRKELARSNGHARLGATGERGELGVLVVKGKGALGERALRERALAEARAQGPGTPVYIVRRVSSGWGSLAEQHGWISALTAPRGGSIGIGYGSRAHGTLEPEVVLRLKEDGSEEPVSGVRFANFLPRQLRDIVAVGETPGVYNVPSGELPWVVGGRGSSVITPALLLRDVELKR